MALARAGFDAIVYEAHLPTATDGGSYLTVATNGLDALGVIGADARVRAAGFPTHTTVLFNGTGKRLGTVPIGSTAAGAESYTIKRPHLHRALHDAATGRGVRFEFGKRLIDAAVSPEGVIARFDDGSQAAGDVLIGCDGVHSITRRIIDPNAPRPRYLGLLNFGGYTPGAAVAPAGVWHMIFGKRAFFGYTTDAAGGTVWFANVPGQPSNPTERMSMTADRWKQWLITQFAGDRGPAPELIAASSLQLTADNTHDLASVPTWCRGPMIVIGDAAHAPSPSAGQGASMALEDGIVLAKCLRDLPDGPRAFAAFARLRRRRVERIVAQGARTSASKAAGPIGRVLRDLMLPWVFRYLVTGKALAWMYDHHIEWDTPVVVGGRRETET